MATIGELQAQKLLEENAEPIELHSEPLNDAVAMSPDWGRGRGDLPRAARPKERAA